MVIRFTDLTDTENLNVDRVKINVGSRRRLHCRVHDLQILQ